jgi:hypothetical protein
MDLGVVKVDLDEGERQIVLMALAALSIERPGWDAALNEIAMKIDNVDRAKGAEPTRPPRAKMYDAFREFRK